MSTIDVHLGSAELRSAESGLCVALESFAQFAASEKDDVDQLRQQLTTACITHQSVDKPWIRPGISFRLILSLHMEALLASHNQDEVVQSLSEHIQGAKVGKKIVQSHAQD